MASADCIDSPQATAKEHPWGLLTIPNVGWQPRNIRSQPPAIVQHLPGEILIAMAILYNGSDHAKLRRRWAVVTTHGLMLIHDIPEDQRPNDPAAFPPGTRLIDGKAEDTAIVENTPRHDLARVPREWTIPLRPLVLSSPVVIPARKGDADV